LILDPQPAYHGPAHAPVLVWRFPVPVRTLASGALGGGWGERAWVLNAEVDLSYDCRDPAADLRAIAGGLGLDPATGVGLLTAARVRDVACADDTGAQCAATVGLSHPTWAAAPDRDWSRWHAGTINLVCWVPQPLTHAALVNAVATITEAKTQALLEAGVPGTGTASDAVVACCPAAPAAPADPSADATRYGGPRSVWGARLARAVHAAVTEGTRRHLTA